MAEFGFKEGIPWLLPVLDEDQLNLSGKHQLTKRQNFGSVAIGDQSFHQLNWKSSRVSQRTRYYSYSNNNNSSGSYGGPGMRAVFLHSGGAGQRSCGTGVFLPRRAGTSSNYSQSSNKLPVLLPARVVQALNLNVHQTGLHIKPQRDAPNSKQYKNVDCNLHKNRKKSHVPAASYYSQEIFLPKEWTY
ncbi:hypothetical protein M9H77_01519 [Catharanthus roseus]|uniref:Uncharacterized protein n=1 Tax=Catharanthus roseus TaxID=4058 RepID=A0ACC0C615_CATRO|nr:hypothetical protein M9H77_01519 [Catharanthus roseus]